MLRPGRNVDINYPGMEPISVMIIGTIRVLPVTVELIDDELVPYRSDRLVQFHSDCGRRTVAVKHLTVR